jgi:hypothetical protein
MHQNAGMKVVYRRTTGLQLVYTIEADRHGTYSIRLGDKLLRHVQAPSDFIGKKRWGSKAQEAALVVAKADIDVLRGMEEH